MSNDIDELTALNRDYVASVQNCDVKRFDEILAQDFYCSNPDKSLVDRAAFLKQTAVPVTTETGRREAELVRAFEETWSTRERFATSMRTAAYGLAVQRVAEATTIRGLYP